jgi:hypothetical protein
VLSRPRADEVERGPLVGSAFAESRSGRATT